MLISIGESTSEVVLCAGDTSAEYPEEFRATFDELAQKAQGWCWPTAKVFGRQNFSSGFTFKVTRVHASHRDACDFAADHSVDIQTLAAAGAYQVAFVFQSGTVAAPDGDTYLLSDGRLTHYECVPIGCSTISSYTLEGGILVYQEPEEE